MLPGVIPTYLTRVEASTGVSKRGWWLNVFSRPEEGALGHPRWSHVTVTVDVAIGQRRACADYSSQRPAKTPYGCKMRSPSGRRKGFGDRVEFIVGGLKVIVSKEPFSLKFEDAVSALL